MSKTFRIQGEDISDGYHTFDELYEHRCLLFINLCLCRKAYSYWSEAYGFWFVLYLDTPRGQISYHISKRLLPLIDGKIEFVTSPKYDGHTSKDVEERLKEMALRVQSGTPEVQVRNGLDTK